MKARGILAVIAVLALVVVSLVAGMEFTNLEGRSYSTTITVSSTRTITLTSSSSLNGPPVIIEEVILEPEIINEICIGLLATTTSTAYLIGIGNQTAAVTTTTETLSVISTTTLYYNVTIVSDGSTCTEINPHYNVTSRCGPCA